MEYYRSANRWEGCGGGFPSAAGHNRVSAGLLRGGCAGSVRAELPESARPPLSPKEDLEFGVRGPTWPPLAVLGEELLVHFPLLLLLFDLGFLVDLLDGLGALVRSPGNPVVLEARETKTWRVALTWQKGGSEVP